MGILVCAIGCFAGVCGGLWGTHGAGAIGIAFGCASGLLFGSFGPFGAARVIGKIEEENARPLEALPDNSTLSK